MPMMFFLNRANTGNSEKLSCSKLWQTVQDNNQRTVDGTAWIPTCQGSYSNTIQNISKLFIKVLHVNVHTCIIECKTHTSWGWSLSSAWECLKLMTCVLLSRLSSSFSSQLPLVKSSLSSTSLSSSDSSMNDESVWSSLKWTFLGGFSIGDSSVFPCDLSTNSRSSGASNSWIL